MLNPSKKIALVALCCCMTGSGLAKDFLPEELIKGVKNLPDKIKTSYETREEWKTFKEKPWPCDNMESCSLNTVCANASYQSYKHCKPLAAKRWIQTYAAGKGKKRLDFSAFTPKDEGDVLMLLDALAKRDPDPGFLKNLVYLIGEIGDDRISGGGGRELLDFLGVGGSSKPFGGSSKPYEIIFPFLTQKITNALQKKYVLKDAEKRGEQTVGTLPIYTLSQYSLVTLTHKFPSEIDPKAAITLNIKDDAQFSKINWETFLTRMNAIEKKGDEGWLIMGSSNRVLFSNQDLFLKALSILKKVSQGKTFSINLSKTNPTPTQLRDLGQWAEGFTIDQLDLSENKLGDGEAKALLEIIPKLAVKKINLKGNRFSDPSLIVLKAKLQKKKVEFEF